MHSKSAEWMELGDGEMRIECVCVGLESSRKKTAPSLVIYFCFVVSPPNNERASHTAIVREVWLSDEYCRECYFFFVVSPWPVRISSAHSSQWQTTVRHTQNAQRSLWYFLFCCVYKSISVPTSIIYSFSLYVFSSVSFSPITRAHSIQLLIFRSHQHILCPPVCEPAFALIHQIINSIVAFAGCSRITLAHQLPK